MTGEIEIPFYHIILRMVPFIVTLLIIVGINFYNPSVEAKQQIIIFNFIINLSYLSLITYLFLTFGVLHSYYRKKNQSPEIRALLFIISCSIFFSFILIFSDTLLKELQFISHVAFFFIPLFFIFFLIRYPHYFSNIQKELEVVKYSNSRLKNLDKKKVIKRLDSLMSHEEIYKESQLTLKILSDELAITSSQLSELLNSYYKTSFTNYINSHRIDEVKRILEVQGNANILQTAIDCGFNSKTAFNNAFRKFTGLSPSLYRKKIRSES
jgi:AraC-like DNA-binding protein